MNRNRIAAKYGKRVLAVRRYFGWNKLRMAHELYIQHPDTLRRVEEGRRIPNAKNRARIDVLYREILLRDRADRAMQRRCSKIPFVGPGGNGGNGGGQIVRRKLTGAEKREIRRLIAHNREYLAKTHIPRMDDRMQLAPMGG